MSDTFADQANENTEVTPVVAEDGSITIGDRKFNGLEDLTKSYVNGQSHIQTLESENANQREALTKAKGVDDVLAKLQEQQRASESTQTSDQSTTTEQNGVITKEDIDSLLERKLQQINSEQAEAENVKVAMQSAKEVFGNDYVTKLSGKAVELGMSEQDALDIARRSPSAFQKLFVGESKLAPSDTSGDINSQAIQAREAPPASARVRLGATRDEALSAWRAAAPKNE